MAKAKKQVEEEDDMPTAPAWMATFADMMTLLMCFFILIMAFSTMEVDKFKLAMGSLKGAFGVLGVQKKLMPNQSWFSPNSPSAISLKEKSVFESMQRMRNIIQKTGMEDKVDVKMLEEGEVFVQIKDNMLFSPGSADMRPNYTKLLAIIAKLFLKDSKNIIVEGHTDNVPIHTSEYPSNWELSMARSLSVLRHFVNKEGIAPGRISASGFGENKPLVVNNSPENRAKNRRVVIRIKM